MPSDDNKAFHGLTSATQEVFEQVSGLECIKDLFLCGETGQSLQMDHRLSEDLDFELLGIRKNRPVLDFNGILGEIKQAFPDAKEEILGEDHFLVFINRGKVKLSFYRPENPVKTMKVGWRHNNLKTPTLQELLGMKIYTICLRTLFRDSVRSKTMYSRLLSPQLFHKDKDFFKMSPRRDITAEEIRDRVKQAMESQT